MQYKNLTKGLRKPPKQFCYMEAAAYLHRAFL